jgi:formylglycine-generating enzyme required for sulfatase activity
MIGELLLGAALEAGLSLLAEVGFGDELRTLRANWARTEERQRRHAFNQAWLAATEAANDVSLIGLLQHRPFQEEVVARLLDPTQGPDLPAIAASYGELLPAQARALRRFFTALETALLDDGIWGPPIERFQEMRHRRNVEQALAERNAALSAHELVHRLSAHLEGTGAIAQDGSVAAGAGGVAVGQLIQVFIQQLIVGETAGPTAGSLRERYLEEVVHVANLLPWGAVDVRHADPNQGESLRLVDVYTALDTTDLRHVEREEQLREFMARIHEADRVPAQEAANEAARLLIMGDPGAGKTTFIKHLAYQLAQARLAVQPDHWLKQLEPWTHGALLPLWVELRQVATFAVEQKKSQGTVSLLLSYLRHMLGQWHLEGYWAELDVALRDHDQGPVLVLLDGLDEAPTAQRQLIVDMVNAFVERYHWHRYVVTCRPYAYIGQPWRLQSFREVTLTPFSPEQIDCFVQNWYEQLAERNRMSHQEATQRMGRLQRALRRPDLRGLAERPLLLTMMAQLHSSANKLPDDRTHLYAESVKLLLERWEARLDGDVGVVQRLAIPGLKMSDLEAGLYDVAYRAHSRQSETVGTADIGEGDLRHWLAPYLGNDYNKAGEFVGYIRERAGLLFRHKTEAYTFPHRTFQEFLAACHLVAGDQVDYVAEAPEMVHRDPTRWREVFLLAAGHAGRNHRLGQAIAAVNGLCPAGPDEASLTDRSALLSALLAGEALLEIGLAGVQRIEPGQALLRRVATWLEKAIRQDAVLKTIERAEAGNVLARLGDPRIEVIDPLHIELLDVPAGSFLMGNDDKAKTFLDNESPQHPYNVAYAYKIGRYPVTNAQFDAFVQAGGYKTPGYWQEAKSHGYWRPGEVQRRWYDEGKWVEEWVSAPADYGEPFTLANHPVVGVNWWEALAFTRWLTEQLRAAGKLPAGWQVRLPSEAEWEKAARGDDGRDFPWLGKIDPDRVNYNAAGIGATSAVGCFPGGASLDRVEELSGNVWEWTRSLYADYPYPAGGQALQQREALSAGDSHSRVLRGGSFANYEDGLRCAARFRYYPGNRSVNVGFRVCASPLPPVSGASGL